MRRRTIDIEVTEYEARVIVEALRYCAAEEAFGRLSDRIGANRLVDVLMRLIDLDGP